MEQIAFRMTLNPGCAAEYRRRHDDIWPELVTLLKASGIADYSIYLHEQTNSLFAILHRSADHKMAALPLEPVMQRWWAHMADIMQTGENNEPRVEPLERLFYMP